MTMGKDTGKDATNVIKTWGCNPAEASPSATSMSKNQGKGKGSYGK